MNRKQTTILRKKMNSPRTPQTTLSAELKSIINARNILTTRTRMKVLSALDEIHQESTAERQKNLRAQAIQEILTSEVTYLHQLEIIMQFFMQPMIERHLLNPASYNILFGNIESLYNVNGALLKELKQDLENVAQAFYKLAPYFKLYSVYAYDYKQALTLLQETQQSNTAVRDFISKQETRPEVSKKLSSLLITPIQRIPRYRLLLKEVLQHTPVRHKDYNILQASLVEVEKVAAHINSLVAEHEDTQKLLELQRHIAGSINLVKPGRKLIRQGPLMRVSRGGSASYRRHFVLLSDTLLYCKGNPDNSLTVCCLLPLNKCTVNRVLSGGLFRVTCLQETLLLYSENGDSEDWIQALQDAVRKYIECRQTLRKDSSSRRPLRKNHVNDFPSENIPEKRYKRKRSEDDPSETGDPNVSKIIYINRDSEGEGTADEVDNCFSFRRLKKMRTNNSANSENRRSWMQRFKFRQSRVSNVPDKNSFYMDSLYPLRYNVVQADSAKMKEPLASTSTSNSGPSSYEDADNHSMESIDLNATDGETNPTKISSQRFEKQRKISQEESQQSWLPLRIVGAFFSGIGTSFRDFLKLR